MNILAMFAEIKRALDDTVDRLGCVLEELRQQRRMLQYEYGLPPAQADVEGGKLAPRQLTRAPTILEGTVTAQLELNLEKECQGRLPSAGFYANLGVDDFYVVLFAPNDQSTLRHTLKAGTSIGITSHLSKIVIVPQVGKSANYQVYLR